MVRFIVCVTFLMFSIVNLTLIAQREIAILRTNEVASLAYTGRLDALSLESASKKIIADHTFQLHFDRNQLLVRAKMEDETGFFMIDTGSPTLLLSTGQLPESTSTVNGQGFKGGVSLLPHTVSSFWLGNEEQGKQSAYLIDIDHFSRRSSRHILGMVGFEQLKEFEMLVDVKNGQIQFLSGRQNPLEELEKPKTSLSFSYDEHLPILSFKNNGKTLRFAIDTGAGSNLLNTKSQAVLAAEFEHLEQFVNLAGLSGEQETIEYVQLPALKLGDLAVGDTRFLPVDLSHLQAPNGPAIDGVVGMDFLQQFLFSINFKKQRLNIWSYPAAKEAVK